MRGRRVLDAGRRPCAGQGLRPFDWTVPPILTGLVADFDPASGIVLSGSKVTDFTSRVNGHTITQVTDAARPVFDATVLNGRPALTYDGAGTFLVGASGIAALLSGLQAYTAYYVGNLGLAGAGFTTPWSVGKSTDNTMFIQEFKNSGTDGDSIGRSETTQTLTASARPLTTAPYDHVGVYNGATYSSFVNGLTGVVAHPNTKAPPALDRFVIGALSFGGAYIQFWNGVIGRFVLYSVAHSPSDMALVRAWLRRGYVL